MLRPPEPNEYVPFFEGYVGLVRSRDIVPLLEEQNRDFVNSLQRLSPQEADYRYLPEKWSVKEVAGHVLDIERAMAYRAFTFSRQEEASLPGIDQDEYTSRGNFDQRDLGELAKEFNLLRQSNIIMYTSLDESALLKSGLAEGNRFTVRALIYIAAGHLEHHRIVLSDRYHVQ